MISARVGRGQLCGAGPGASALLCSALRVSVSLSVGEWWGN